MALNHWIQGEEVDAADFQQENVEFLDLIGALVQLFFGRQSFQGGNYPLQAVASGQSVVIGGPDQQCNIAARVCSDILAATFPIALNPAGVPRVDMLYGTGVEVDRYPFTRNVRNPDRSITAQTVFSSVHDIAWIFVQGNADGSPGPAPGGNNQPIAQIVARPGNAALAQSDITIVLPTLQSVLAALSVTSVDGITGDVTIAGSPFLGVTPSGKTVTLTNLGVETLQGVVGAVRIHSSDGSMLINPVVDGVDLSVNFPAVVAGVTSFQGAKGAVALTSANGTVRVLATPTGADLSVVVEPVEGVTSFQTVKGAVRITSIDDSIDLTNESYGVDLSAAQQVMATAAQSAAAHGTTPVAMTLGPGTWFVECEMVGAGANLETSIGYASGGHWTQIASAKGECSDYNSALQQSSAVAKLCGNVEVVNTPQVITFNFASTTQNASQPSAVLPQVCVVRAILYHG